VFPVADVLRFRGIPFIFSTGYDFRSLPERFRSCPTLSKPFSYDNFATTLRSTLAGTSDTPEVV